MKSNLSQIIVVFALLFTLASCLPAISAPTPSLTLPPVITVVPTPTATESVIIQTTATPIPPTACLTVAHPLPQDLNMQGKVVLSGVFFDTASVLMDLSSRESTVLRLRKEDETIPDWMFAVSPNRTQLAYGELIDEQHHWLHIITADGKEQKSLLMDPDWIAFTWLDNSRLLFYEYLKEGRYISPLIVVNPFTEEKQELSFDYPDLFTFDRLEWGFFSVSRTAYNQTLTKVAYPAAEIEGVFLRIVDVQTGETLVDMPTNYLVKQPTWSPDAKRLAFIMTVSRGRKMFGLEDIFLIGEDGQSTQLTHLSEIYTDYLRIDDPIWSPDGEFLAFWLTPSTTYTDRRLAVLDTSNGNVHEYCSTGDLEVFSDPIWSPDGKYLLIGLSSGERDDLHSIVLIIDSATGEVFQIAEDYQPKGWLK